MLYDFFTSDRLRLVQELVEINADGAVDNGFDPDVVLATEQAFQAVPDGDTAIDLSDAEAAVAHACFEVGGEDNPDVTDEDWRTILAVLKPAAQTEIA